MPLNDVLLYMFYSNYILIIGLLQCNMAEGVQKTLLSCDDEP